MPSPYGSGSDMRRWKRFPVDVSVRLVVHRPSKVDSTEGSGTALSEGGMCVVAGIEMQPGEQVTVEFTPPSTDDHLRLWAAVRNRHGHQYGLEFLDENNSERAQVERYRNDLRAAMEEN